MIHTLCDNGNLGKEVRVTWVVMAAAELQTLNNHALLEL